MSVTFIDCSAEDNGGAGFLLDANAVLVRCTANRNVGGGFVTKDKRDLAGQLGFPDADPQALAALLQLLHGHKPSHRVAVASESGLLQKLGKFIGTGKSAVEWLAEIASKPAVQDLIKMLSN
jgi:hypothetical protein